MDGIGWTRESLVDFVAGKRLYARSLEGEQIDAPDWLAAAAGDVSPLDSARSVDATHPDDRGVLIESFLAAMEAPGVPISRQIRVDIDGEWGHHEVVWVNLLDHPEVLAMIGVSRPVDGPAFDAPTRLVEGTMAATNWMIVQLDHTGRIADVRGRLGEILGFELDEVSGQLLTEFIHPDCVPDAIENWVNLWEHPEQTRTSRWVWRQKDRSDVWLESSYLVHDDGEVEVVIVDVNEQVAHEEALAASQREVATLAEDFRLLADEVPTAVFRCDAQGQVQFHNAQWGEMFTTGGGDPLRIQDVIDDAERHTFEALLASLAEGRSSVSQSIEVRAAGEARVLEIRCRAVGGTTDVARFVGSITDVTAAAQFRHQALHDPLTGLANRTRIEATLAEAVTTDPAGTVVVFIDLDGFKAVNDEHGHEAGDLVLVEIASRLARVVRPGDSVSRYGGDEFVVVCRGVSGSGDRQIIDRLSEVFDQPICIDGAEWMPRASLGLARPEPDVDWATVLRRADQAMFEQKRAHAGAAARARGA